jgi:Rps23 Pro-64 3,4-dihydroxylase Tpa1-like proline 4-hydroxylase
MLRNWINPIYLSEDKIAELKEEFLSGEPYQHIVIKDFLLEEKAEEILNSLKTQKYELYDSEKEKYLKIVEFDKLNSIIYKFRNLLMSEKFVKFLNNITDSNLNRSKVSVQSIKMENTHYMLCHNDLEVGQKITFVFHFSKDWTGEDGGSLNLFSNTNRKPTKVTKKIVPDFNQLSIFKIDHISYHEVEEVISNKSRITIGGWYK